MKKATEQQIVSRFAVLVEMGGGTVREYGAALLAAGLLDGYAESARKSMPEAHLCRWSKLKLVAHDRVKAMYTPICGVAEFAALRDDMNSSRGAKISATKKVVNTAKRRAPRWCAAPISDSNLAPWVRGLA